jgi:hypothetical protein
VACAPKDSAGQARSVFSDARSTYKTMRKYRGDASIENRQSRPKSFAVDRKDSKSGADSCVLTAVFEYGQF